MDLKKELREKIRVLDVERSKHKRLLNKYVRSANLVYINYHHAEIVRIINETNIIQSQINDEIRKDPLIGLISKEYEKLLYEKLNDFIFKGEV